MGKQNTKAGSTQISQDVAAVAAAEQSVTDTGNTPAQQQTGVQDNSVQVAEGAAVAAVVAGSEEPVGELPPNPNGEGEGEEELIVAPEPVVAPAPAVVEKVIVVEAAKPTTGKEDMAEHLAEILKDVPAAYQLDIGRILTYVDRMSPKRPIDSKAGVVEQVALYRSIQRIINNHEEYFKQLFSALLFIFKSETKGALGDRYRMRFMDNVTLHAGDRKAFTEISLMLSILADPKGRDIGMTQINMNRALENGLSVEGRNRVLDYFGI